jgi:hypothetical protein
MNRSCNAENEEEILLKIASALKTVSYGSIQITIHDSKVVQIDKIEKFRLLDGQNLKPKGGETYTTDKR